VVYCISSVIILILLSIHIAPALLALFSTSRNVCLSFTAIPLLYYLWCYSTTVYSSYLVQYGYEVAFTMSALFTLLFLVFALVQHKRREDGEIMKELERAKNAEQEAKLEAIRANKAKGEFLASMSHEIRTPINAVLGIDEMILRECTDPQILDYAIKIKTSGQSLLYLINDILDLSKIESDQMDIDPVEYEPKTLISEILLMIEPRLDAKGLRLHYNIDPRIPSKLYGDDMRIQQILINLLTNAAKYTDEGKVTLTVELVEKTDNNVKLHFSVKDTGIGIKKEDQELLFESFRRVDLAHNKRIEGTGLGLSITLKLLRLMNSDLELQSVYGIGSDFHFTLQQQIIDAQEMGTFQKGFQEVAIADTYREGFIAPDAKVLAIDDNDLNLIVFKGLLKNSQMNIKTASSGQEALDIIKNEAFDLVFMDHLMPKMDGIEALQLILADNDLRKNAPVIIALTANAVVGAKEMYLQAGFSGYLKKPINGQELEKTIREFLPAEKLFDADTSLVVDVQEPQTVENYDNDIINQTIGINCCAGDRNFYYEVLKAFTLSNFPETLEKLYAEKNWKDYQITIHGIKSGAKSIGAMPLSELALDLELALKERNDVEYVISKHSTVLQAIAEVENTINEIVTKGA
ncbi:MAG: response regulator, partial [Erysipelotrichales bacterium]|nr:response regulator [Erysipelotrichales bacterium]